MSKKLSNKCVFNFQEVDNDLKIGPVRGVDKVANSFYLRRGCLEIVFGPNNNVPRVKFPDFVSKFPYNGGLFSPGSGFGEKDKVPEN